MAGLVDLTIRLRQGAGIFRPGSYTIGTLKSGCLKKREATKKLMNRKTTISALFFVAVALAAFAQEVPTAKPETLGLSSERLERISTAVQRGIDDKRIAGAVTLVARRGHVAWF